VGPFDEELVRNQDDELNLRIVQNGGHIWLDPHLRTSYTPRGTFRLLWTQYFQYGLYKVRVIQKRRAVASARHLVPVVFVLALPISLVAGAFSGRRWLLLSVAAPYIVSNCVASLVVARSDPASLPRLPFVFATVHLAYGAGFAAGLWRWRTA
jgi:hypothetical protein